MTLDGRITDALTVARGPARRARPRRGDATPGRTPMTELHVLRVFLGPDGGGGNPLGVFVDGRAIAPGRRQAVAHELELQRDGLRRCGRRTASRGSRSSRRRPSCRSPGHPTVGTSWLLAHLGPPGRDAPRARRRRRHVAGRRARPGSGRAPDGSTGFEIRQLASAAEVDALRPGPLGEPGRYVWAWDDEAAGRLRSRYFPTDYGIVEDEATGAAAVVMGDRLGRPLTIRQGVGLGAARPSRPGGGTVDVGGRVELDASGAFDR